MKNTISKLVNILSFVLAFTILLGILPMNAWAAGDNISSEIQAVYREAKKSAGISSFSGWCGAYIGHQLKVIGINKAYIGTDGKYAFDTYKALNKTTGGYDVLAYDASSFSLKQALNKISNNGSKTVRNILVGFERGSNTWEGRTYGHAVLIHQISGGTVFFSESFGVNMNGRYYPEGSAISCSIDSFCAYYESWAVYEGAVFFRRYLEECSYYPCFAKSVKITKNGTVYMKSYPCSRNTYSKSEDIAKGHLGQLYCVTGLWRNTEGNYFYELRLSNGTVAYIFAGDAAVVHPTYSITGYDSVDGRSLVQGWRYVC